MLDAKTRLLTPALAVLAAVALSGCEASKDGDPFPASAPETFNALFSLTTGQLPFPSDVPGFIGSTDGTLNYTGALNAAPLRLTGPSLNTLDGFSTSAHITTGFNQPIRAESISGSNIRMIELYLSNTTKAPASGAELPPGVASPVRRVLTFGTDFTAAVSDSPETGGRLLEITPLKPLTPSTGATNIGYLVVLTNGITDIALRAAQPSADYAAIKDATSCGSIADATLAALCPLYKGQLLIAQAVGIDPATVVLTWSFTTQSISDPFIALDATVTAQPIGVVPTGLTTQQVNAALPGKANLYVGTTVLPYYSAVPANVNDRTVLTSFWLAAGPPPAPLDQTSRFITRFNPLPAKRADVTVPLLVTVPNATAAGGAGCPKPAAGWPVVIVQHGITRDRTDALAMADSFADACFIVAAIDLPFHGITNTANPFYQAANERTFNLDLVNNTTGAATPDGVIDTSGTHSISVLLSSPLTGRDSLRQGEADLGVLAKSLVNLDVTADAQPDIDRTRIHFVGLSLGGIVGVAQARFAPGVRTATVAAPGGLVTQLLLESATFGPTVSRTISSNFAAAGLSVPANSVLFNNFFREVQTVADPGDPINHVCQCAQLKPLHLIKVLGDTVVPNSATDRLITAGNLRKLSALGPNAVGPGQGAYVAFTQGSHGSLFDPTASLAATAEMQRQTVLFAASAVQPGGPFVVITNPAVIQP
jgi:dienelactone hydrolase